MKTNDILEYLIPDRLKMDRTVFTSAKMTIGIIMALALSSIIYSSLYFFVGHVWGGGVILSGSLICFIGLLQIRMNVSLPTLGHQLVLTMFLIQVFLSVTSGGVLAPNTMWLATVPVLAVVLNGIKSGILWSLLCSLFVSFLLLSSILGYVFPNYIQLKHLELKIFQVVVVIGLVCFIAAFYLIFERMRQKAVQESERLRVLAEDSALALEAATEQLVETAHRAGMADIASGALHNIGNLLNNVKTSLFAIRSRMQQPFLNELQKANNYLEENLGNTVDFVDGQSSIAQSIVEYYKLLEEKAESDINSIFQELDLLSVKVNSIADVVASQQRFAGFSSLTEMHSIELLILDVLAIEAPNLELMEIKVETQFDLFPKVKIQKIKLLHILVNLLNNARDALQHNDRNDRRIEIILKQDNDFAVLKVSDNGCGILKEDQKKVFTHGYTTKTERYGFGLHSSALYMEDMKGSISVESEGLGKGAAFSLFFPLS